MISYELYRLIHLFGIFLVMVALGAAAAHAAGGGDRKANPGRGRLLAAHGIGLVLMLVAGFGMLARLGVPMGGWFWAKFGLWLVLGASTALPYKYPALARWAVFAFPVLGLLAGYLARYKPF